MEKTQALKILAETPITLHCWQTDDVAGFEVDAMAGGGIQSTGNYPGKARNKEEVFEDLEFVINNLGGKFRINLHAFYHDKGTPRDQISVNEFTDWIEFAKRMNVGIDFNPTFFGHPKAEAGFTLSSTDEEIRKFWVDHGKASLRAAQGIAEAMGDECLFNIWIPDGSKEVPLNRYKHRELLRKSLDEIIGIDYNKDLVKISVESKVFGIGLESFTVGSHEFYLSYANSRGINCLIDSGHFHPMENVADKLSSMLLFNDKVALHLTRPVRWDSDHTTLQNQDLSDIADELVRLGLHKFYIGLDFFDGSINRLFAYISGVRNVQRTFLNSLLNYEKSNDDLETTSMNILKYEFLKNDFDLKAIWKEYCAQQGVPSDKEVLAKIEAQERDVLSKRV